MATLSTATPARPLTVALIGNPNTGKSTLFNALAGMQSRVGNFPGCTVEKKIGRMKCEGRTVSLVDLPGTYSLSPRSPDEMVSVDVLLGRQKDVGRPDAVVCIVDAANLERNLYLVSQVLDIGLPTVLVLNMFDVAEARGLKIDVPALERALGVPVVPARSHRRQGLDDVRHAILRLGHESPPAPRLFPDAFYEERSQLAARLAEWGCPRLPDYLLDRMLLDVRGQVEANFDAATPTDLHAYLAETRQRLTAAGCRIPAVESKVRYAWAREIVGAAVAHPAQRAVTASDKIDRLLTHKVVGLLVFSAMMFLVFLSIFLGAEPFMGLIESAQDWLGAQVSTAMQPGPLRSLLVDGVIAGVGGVIVFLPQIVFLFLFIALLEDCGYMSRAAFLMDKLMTRIGLSGKSFVPLMSSFACAIPGVMATRVIENRRDRMVTILVAPLMSCSARLPVYILLISLFIPAENLLQRGLMLFAMYVLGIVTAVPVAWVLKKTWFKGETPPFVMELPGYKWPSPRIVLSRVYDRAKAFVTRAGTLILATTVIVWALGYFPADHTADHRLQAEIEPIEAEIGGPLAEAEARLEPLTQAREASADLLAEDVTDKARATAVRKMPSRPANVTDDTTELSRADLEAWMAKLDTEIAELQPQVDAWHSQLDPLYAKQNGLRASLIERSFLGRMGHAVEPLVRPLGWDWKIGVGAIASFPAREVIISTLGTIYALGGDVDEQSLDLKEQIRSEIQPQERLVPVALSIMVFFALCAQCAATLLVIARETNSWFWPAFTFTYMTVLAYIGALATYQVGMWIV